MSQSLCLSTIFTMRIRWMWKSDSDLARDCSRTMDWSYFSDVDNWIIEEKHINNETDVILDDCTIDLIKQIVIFHDDPKKIRHIERVEYSNDEKRFRNGRFKIDPIAPKRSFGNQYGWVSPFILETKKYLKLHERRSPSKDNTIIPWIVEKAALGIIEEGKKAGDEIKAQRMGNELMSLKHSSIEDVWILCTRLYTMDSFLYRKLNDCMRSIGSNEHENVWKSKVPTFGPYSLLLWDNPFSRKPNKTKKILYRGSDLTEEQIKAYKSCLDCSDEYRSFQAFTSCTRNRNLAQIFSANVLFIMEIACAFTADLQLYSMFPEEEEELIIPGVCFTVQKVESDATDKNHIIYLQLRHRHNPTGQTELTATIPTSINRPPTHLLLSALFAAEDPYKDNQFRNQNVEYSFELARFRDNDTRDFDYDLDGFRLK